jgi:hypothetical protein
VQTTTAAAAAPIVVIANTIGNMTQQAIDAVGGAHTRGLGDIDLETWSSGQKERL